MVALLLRFTRSEKTNLPDGSYSTHHVLLRIPVVDKDLEDTLRQGWHLDDADIMRIE